MMLQSEFDVPTLCGTFDLLPAASMVYVKTVAMVCLYGTQCVMGR